MNKYKIGCRDLGGMDCNFSAEGSSPEEVKKNLYAHAGESHKDILASMPEEKMKEMDQLMDKLLAEQN
jgi:predicted small metal-binding protein